MEVVGVTLEAQVKARAEAVAVPLTVEADSDDGVSVVRGWGVLDLAAERYVAADLNGGVARVRWWLVWAWVTERWIDGVELGRAGEPSGASCDKTSQKR